MAAGDGRDLSGHGNVRLGTGGNSEPAAGFRSAAFCFVVAETASLADAPYGWRLDHGTGAYAQFFGGQTSASPYAIMWQWSGGGGVRNGFGDFDQIDGARQG